ncbi:MAG: hypothetical protein J2P15_19125 [Micromonosporaceae bacterium]|nr:hypothetical protein [Micromonosporaceae bacterium]
MAEDAQSLEQIEGKAWGDPPPEATSMIAAVHRLRRVPVGSLDPEGLRLLIAQRVGVETLVPRALTALSAEPLLEADYYPGDVLVAVLRVPAAYWTAHPQELGRLTQIIASIEEPDPELKDDIDAFWAAVSPESAPSAAPRDPGVQPG